MFSHNTFTVKLIVCVREEDENGFIQKKRDPDFDISKNMFPLTSFPQ